MQDTSLCKGKGDQVIDDEKSKTNTNADTITKTKTNLKADMHVKWELPCLDRRTQNEQINWCKLCGSRNANTHQILTRSLQTFSCRLFTNTESKEAIWGTYSSSKISGESCFPIISCQRIRTKDQREWVFEVREVKSENKKLSLFFEKCKVKKKCFHSFSRSAK